MHTGDEVPAGTEVESTGTSGEAPSADQHYPEQRPSFGRPEAQPPRPRARESIWGLALRRVGYRLYNDPLEILAAGVALFGIMSLLPGLAALISIYSLVADPADIRAQIAPLADIVPHDVVGVVVSQLEGAASSSAPALGFAFATSLAIALFSATSGISSLMTALNLAHNHPERRSWFRRTGIALALAIGGLLTVIIAVSLVVLLPTVLRIVRVDADTELLISLARWPALSLMVVVGLAVVYRVGPVDPTRRVFAGAAVATLLWIIVSAGLSLYVDRVANYSGLYGAFGGVLVLVLWFYLSAFAVLIGAVLNEELAEARWRRSNAGAPPRPRPGLRIRAA